MRRKVIGRERRTRAGSVVRIEEDSGGRQWVVCMGCRRELAGGKAAALRQRQHAESCVR